MVHRSKLAMRWSAYALVGLTVVLLAEDARAQIFGRRVLRRDARAMEEYYDDLEDYYEDRNPRLAREARRMEKYYEDVRKGRAGAPPIVSLPGVRLLIEPRLRELDRAAAAPAMSSAPSRSRWQQWGATSPAESRTPTEARLPSQRQEPTVAEPQPNEVRRASYEQDLPGTELRFPPNSVSDNPTASLGKLHAGMVQELEQIGRKNPAAAEQWREYLALPDHDGANLTGADYYATATGRDQLTATLERYDQVAGDPQFRPITRLPGFSATRAALRKLHASLKQQPTLAEPAEATFDAEELPSPPAN